LDELYLAKNNREFDEKYIEEMILGLKF